MLHYLQDLGKGTWAYQDRDLLWENGFRDACFQQAVRHVKTFVSVFKQRSIDQFQQKWNASVREKERFDFYSLFKQCIQAEKYIDFPQLRCYREAYVHFRYGMWPILVHRIRHRKNVISKFWCALFTCKEEIENETYVLFSCKDYNDLRNNVKLLEMAYTDSPDVILCGWLGLKHQLTN